MFLKRRRPSDGGGDDTATPTSKLTTLRDIVEIVAIVTAGAWAFYTFVYENQIKPTYSKPEAQVLGSLTRLGERRGLIAVRSGVEIRNIGSTSVAIYGFAETVTGSTVVARENGRLQQATQGTTVLAQPYWHDVRKTSVFAFGLLTKIADSRAKSEFELRPGRSVTLDRILYVPARRFDESQMRVALRFSAQPKALPFRLETSDGVLHVTALSDAARSAEEFDDTTAPLSLWASR